MARTYIPTGRPRGRPRKGVPALAPPSQDMEQRTPLVYMLAVMNDPTVNEARRDRMAIAAAPFVHKRESDKPIGKKEEEKKLATQAGKAGRFATPPTPLRLIASNQS